MGAYYALQRGWRDDAMFANRGIFDRGSAWLWMVEHAACEPIVARIGGHSVNLARGELSVSIRDMGGQWGWATTKVARFVAELNLRCFIGTVKIGQTVVITICNYDGFECQGQEKNCTQRNASGTVPVQFAGGRAHVDAPAVIKIPSIEGIDSKGKTLSLTREVKKDATMGTRLPSDFSMPLGWLDDGAAARMKANLPAADLVTESVKFANYWIAKSGRDGTKRDWHRTWINWCLNVKGQANGRSSTFDNLIEGFGRAAGLGGSPDREPDWPAADPLLDGQHAGGDARGSGRRLA